MFNVGGGEFLIILLVALVVLGPAKLPEAARQIGKIVGEFRRLSSGFQAEMQAAINDPVSKVTGEATPTSFADVTKVAEAGPIESAEPAEPVTPKPDPYGGSTRSTTARGAEPAEPHPSADPPAASDSAAESTAGTEPEPPMFGDR